MNNKAFFITPYSRNQYYRLDKRKPYICDMIQFYKYHGAGNDFIMLNLLEEHIELSQKQIWQLCDRHKGIGADGLMLLIPSEDSDFEMKYYNSDGHEGSMCGNGGRCIVSFAYDMGIELDEFEFMAVDGLHKAYILEINDKQKIIKLQMADVDLVSTVNGQMVIDTGSPHYLDFRESVADVDVYTEGKTIRYSENFKDKGVNVNFVEGKGNRLFVRTYERGVENETLACGTGVTAAAIASSIQQNLKYKDFDIKTKGGELKVTFDTVDGQRFTNIFLRGPAEFVFTGAIDIE